MTEAQILAKTYRDKLTVCRGQPGVDEEGESIMKSVLIYEGIPCALSSASQGKPEREVRHRIVDTEMTIFTSPDILLKDMDRVTVTTAAGQIYRGRSGRTLSYAGSHGETPFLIEDMA